MNATQHNKGAETMEKYNKAKDMGIDDYKEIQLFEGYERFLKDAEQFELHLWKIAERHFELDGLTRGQHSHYVGRLSHELVIRYQSGINDDQIYEACQIVASEFFN
jgi:hypothetical protein